MSEFKHEEMSDIKIQSISPNAAERLTPGEPATQPSQRNIDLFGRWLSKNRYVIIISYTSFCLGFMIGVFVKEATC